MKNLHFISVLVSIVISVSAYGVDINGDSLYLNVLDSVSEATNRHDVYSARSMFTDDGFQQYLKFMEITKATFNSVNKHRLVDFGESVYCVRIPVELHPNDTITLQRKITLALNRERKVTGVQMALDSAVCMDIVSNMMIGKEHKLAIINFLEFYQTAYTLRQMDYIDDLFSDNAVMLVGSKMQAEGDLNLNQIAINSFYYRKYAVTDYLDLLQKAFGSFGWVDISLSEIIISITENKNLYGINFVSDFTSATFGQKSRLFFVLDLKDPHSPKIIYRVWQPYDKDAERFGMQDYLKAIGVN